MDGPDGVLAWAAFVRTHVAVVRRLERELHEATGLSLAWYDALSELDAAPERPLRMQQLSDRVVLSRSRVSRVVDELVRAGLARREPDPVDGRGRTAVITGQGRQRLREATPVYLRGIAEHFTQYLTDDEVRLLRSAFERILAAQSA